jgi:hypothetical protein
MRGRSGRWIVPDAQVALHSTRPSRRLYYAGVIGLQPCQPEGARLLAGANRVRRKHDILTNRPLYAPFMPRRENDRGQPPECRLGAADYPEMT